RSSLVLLCSFTRYSPLPDLPSFPTRRSSDLVPKVSSASRSPLTLETPLRDSAWCRPGSISSDSSSSTDWLRLLPVRRSGCQGVSDRKSTRLNSSHVKISYAVFCLKKKKKETI